MTEERTRELCRLIAESYSLYTEKISRRFQAVHTDLLPNVQYLLLCIIAQEEPITASELSAKAMMQKQQATHALNQLETKGLIVRLRNSDDRRVVWLRTTAKAQELLSGIRRELEGQLTSALDELDDDMLIRYIDAMHTIMEALRRISSPDAPSAPPAQK